MIYTKKQDNFFGPKADNELSSFVLLLNLAPVKLYFQLASKLLVRNESDWPKQHTEIRIYSRLFF